MESRYPFPAFPDGWYCVSWSDDLAAGDVQARTLFGQEVVLFRTESGEAVLMGAYCPHLGAHLGHGGTVEGETLRCPFHGFEFDRTGECTKTAYGSPPPRNCKTKIWPVREHDGVVLAWHAGEGAEPWFEVPRWDDAPFGRVHGHTWMELASHPQETTENSVDFGHFAVVHGYSDTDTLKPLKLDGPYLTAQYQLGRTNPFLGRFGPKLKASFEVHVWGLGYSLVEVEVPAMGMRLRHYVLPTPTDGTNIELRVGVAIHRLESANKILPGLGLLPEAFLRELIGRTTIKEYASDVHDDFDVWKNKVYVHPPLLAQGDGPITKYRRWCRQFYPELRKPRKDKAS